MYDQEHTFYNDLDLVLMSSVGAMDEMKRKVRWYTFHNANNLVGSLVRLGSCPQIHVQQIYEDLLLTRRDTVCQLYYIQSLSTIELMLKYKIVADAFVNVKEFHSYAKIGTNAGAQ